MITYHKWCVGGVCVWVVCVVGLCGRGGGGVGVVCVWVGCVSYYLIILFCSFFGEGGGAFLRVISCELTVINYKL